MNCELPEVIKAKTSYKGECSGVCVGWGGGGLVRGFSLSHADVLSVWQEGKGEAWLSGGLVFSPPYSVPIASPVILALDGWILWVRGVA